MTKRLYGLDNALIEGWATYSEDLVFDALRLESKLAALQLRLLRMARAFLDPGVHTEGLTIADVHRVLVDELGFSEDMAAEEVKRYFFSGPAQATSYYFGRRTLLELKADVRTILGDKYSERCFHAAFLDLGFVPMTMARDAILAKARAGRLCS